jgi:hypothetical protein
MKKYLLISLLLGGCISQKQHAEAEARGWLDRTMPGQWDTVECANIDTDKNGYTSCTVSMRNHTTMAIECVNEPVLALVANHGCRSLSVPINRRN